MVSIEAGVTFTLDSGVTITVLGAPTDFESVGFAEDGRFFIDGLYFNPHNDVVLTAPGGPSSPGVLTGEFRHEVGDVFSRFGLSSRVPNGKVDIEIRDIEPKEWYRLEFNTVLAQTDSGRANGRASVNGTLGFNGVNIPNE